MAIVNEVVTEFSFKGNTAPLAKYNKALGVAIKGMAGFATAMVGFVATGGTVLAMVNQQTTEISNQAEAVGITTEKYLAWGQAAKTLGLDQMVVIDLVEEMNNKLGESAKLNKPLSAVTDAFTILGLEYDNIKNLDPGQQFEEIARAIDKMPDPQQAASAADILFGGEANKFFSTLKKQGLSLGEIVAKYQKINFLTKEGTEGAKKYSASINYMGSLFSSVGREIAGVIGGHLSPELESMTEAFSDLIKENKEWIINVSKKVVDGILAISKALVRLTPVLMAGAAAWGALTLATGGFAAIMAVVTSPVTLFIAAGAAALLIIDDLIVAFNGGESAIAGFIKELTGFDIVPVLQGTVDAVLWAVDQVIAGFKQWFDYISWGWNQYQNIIGTVSDFFGGGDSDININNNLTRVATSGQSGGGRNTRNSIENTNNITINANNAMEAKQGVDSALQDQLRNTETVLNRID